MLKKHIARNLTKSSERKKNTLAHSSTLSKAPFTPLCQVYQSATAPAHDARVSACVRACLCGSPTVRRTESRPSEQLEAQIDRWALTVRVTLVKGWSKGEAGKAAGCVCRSVGAV